MLSRFHLHIHFLVFAYRQRCVSQGPCGPTYGFLENLRLLRVDNESVCWWCQISSKIVGKPTKNDMSRFIWLKVSTWWYRNIDFYNYLFNHVKWCARRSCCNGGFKIRERPWRYHAIESPCLVTELLLRRLALDSKILLQNPVNTV